MGLTRRNMMLAGTSAFAVATFCGIPVLASAVDEHIAAFTGGADAVDGAIELDTPEIAENGNTVPITVSAPGASSIMILAAGNPVPAVATFNFGPMSAARSGSTRIRLAKTQDVIAVAKMEDGSFQTTQAMVKVTIGGCGG
ncbi:MAG: thiosulfate oxidation carrier protein SoxY [Rhodobacteraceae bacterium]|nr:thiosulfate oxidation carrier protein SoxY [Paracoccaceae bacterium]MBL6788782.1 thiosulfate oxidation carrier protein SoxY [Paracoccaceae bacterium]MBL6860311.1 thiosulfate oxidation carrier protein SoxY [Paracoccaceae bacterium]